VGTTRGASDSDGGRATATDVFHFFSFSSCLLLSSASRCNIIYVVLFISCGLVCLSLQINYGLFIYLFIIIIVVVVI
jgi:hypothetical protein